VARYSRETGAAKKPKMRFGGYASYPIGFLCQIGPSENKVKVFHSQQKMKFF